MKIFLALYLFLYINPVLHAQEQVVFKTSKKKVYLPFKLVNNLIIVPIKVNGTELHFLLDSGIEETILFSLDEKKELPLYNVEKIALKGLGANEAIEGLKSYKNTLSIKNLDFLNQEIVVVLNQDLNFSTVLGTEVNGIIGYHFFNQNIVEIDYVNRNVIVYNPEKYNEYKVTSKFEVFNFTLENAKPYLELEVELNTNTFTSKCLIDTGNSDGLWLFESKSNQIVVPAKNFDDYLGRGFSGEIFGKKAKVETLTLGEFNFKGVISAFPDSISLSNVQMVENRTGSIGGELLRRFRVIFDYRKNIMYLKKNRYFKDKFMYNTSGITVHHVGLQWYKEEIRMDGLVINQDVNTYQNNTTELKYNFKLIPVYEILNIRKNSPAEKSGLLSGDKLIAVNGTLIYKMSLDKINRLFKQEGDHEVVILVSRNEKEIVFRFKITDLL